VVAGEGWIQVLGVGGEAGGGVTAAAARQQLACGAGQPARDPRGAELSLPAQNTRSAAGASPLHGRGEEGRT
jgi:hypothetical protein